MDFLIEILGNSQMLDAELEDINPVVVAVQGMDFRQLMLDSLRSAGLWLKRSFVIFEFKPEIADLTFLKYWEIQNFSHFRSFYIFC